MKTKERKAEERKVVVEPKPSKYAGKPLNSDKEASAKKHQGAAMEIAKQFGLIK